MMNSVQETKEWQMNQSTTTTTSPSPMQSPSRGDSPATANTTQANNDNNNTYPPTASMHHPQPYLYTQNTMVHSPLQPYPQQEQRSAHSPPGFMATAPKEESDPRLPGLMVLSQPGTPRPNSVISSDGGSPNTKKARHSYVSAFPSMPYPVMPRKRSRNEGALFPTETGPSFSAAKPLDNLYSPDRTNLLTVRVQSKMDRGFFLADNDWTCYRRNYFQVSSTFSIHGINPYFGEHELQCFVQTTHQGLQPVARFVLGISARVSNSDKTVDLIQHTPKRDKGPQIIPEPKSIAPGGNLSLSSVGNTQNIATFERIQFKTATANNGKRRAAQQYYVVVVDLLAETHHGERVSVASCVSSPLVVRGRSPGHYADNQDRSSTTVSNANMMAAAAAAAAAAATAGPGAHGDDPYGHYHKPPMTPPAAAMMASNGSGGGYGVPYGYYNAYSHGPFPPQMMMPNPHMPLPTPTSSSPHSAIGGSSSSSSTTSSSTGGGPSVTSPHAHQPYMVHSVSEPSSSESSSPDLYQSPSDYPLHQSDKPHHPSQLHVQSLTMDPANGGGAGHGQWSRSRYHSAGSVPSPSVEHHPSYFSQQQQHHHHTNGAPPTPTTPFSTKKYDTIPSTEQRQQTS